MSATAPTIGAHSQILTNLSITVAVVHGFLDLLFCDGFAHANVHKKYLHLRITIDVMLNLG
jgi:hypothetical protein